MDCSPPGFSVHEDPPDKNSGACCHALLQGVFPTQGSNAGHLHCRQILYHLSLPGKPKNTGVGNLSFLQGTFLTQELNWGLLQLQVDSLPAEPPGKPFVVITIKIECTSIF